MKVAVLLVILSAAVGTLSFQVELPADVPRSISEFRQKHPFQKRQNGDGRKIYTVRASNSDTDDVANEFLAGLKAANHGGTVHLPENKTFIIGKALDLTFLDDVHVHLEGELKANDRATP
jgi:galacturan 1,4-alpha-galacturonidase